MFVEANASPANNGEPCFFCLAFRDCEIRRNISIGFCPQFLAQSS